MFKAKVKFRMCALSLVGAGVAFAFLATVFAQPFTQSSQTVEITDLVVLDAKTDKVESVFPKGAKIQIEVRFTDLRNLTAYDDDDPDYDENYVVVFEVRDDDDKLIYSTDDTLDGNTELQLEPEERKKITYSWNAPFDTDSGNHQIIITVRDAENFSNIQDEQTRRIIIQNSAASLFVSRSSIDFGEVEDDDTPQARIIVANPNRQAGDLIWKVVELPDWLELISPPTSDDDPQESVLVTNNQTIILQVRSTTLKGSFDDRLKIESNAGTSTIDVSISLDRKANGLVSQLKVRSSVYKPGDEAIFLYRVKNDGAVTMTYSVTFLVKGPTGSLFYNSNAEGHDVMLGPLDPNDESDTMEFLWTIPFGTLAGDYELAGQLRGYQAFEFLFDDVPFPSDAGKSGPPARGDEVTDGDTFEVGKGALIAVSPPDWAFGAITEGDSDRASFAVSNNGRGTLEWTVVSWPEWLEVKSPTDTVRGRDSIEVAISESAQPGNLSGTIEIESNGGPRSIKVSVRVLPLPTATVGIATVLARLRPTATPKPTATPSRIPTATPTPPPLEPVILSGRLTIRNGGSIPDNARLIAKIGDYTSLPAAIDGDSYGSLVILPPDRSYVGQPIQIYLDDLPALMKAPLRILQGGPIRFDLTFAALPTVTATPQPERTPTATPTVESLSGAGAVAVALPTATPTEEASRPTPDPPEPSESSTPQVFITAESVQDPAAAGSAGCSAPGGHVGWATGLTHATLLIMPIGLVAGIRMNRRREKSRRLGARPSGSPP